MSAAQDDLRSQLESAFKAQAEPPAEVETEATETAVTEVESEPTQERARDDKGRFVARDSATAERDSEGVREASGAAEQRGAVSDAEAQRTAEAAAEGPKDGPDGASKAQEQALAPPNGWPAEAKAKWHELPAEIMAAVQKREQDIAKFTSQRDEHASFGKDMYQAVQPYMPIIRAEGGTPRTAVEALLNTAYLLRTGSPEQKKQLLLQTARQYGVDLGEPAQPNTTTLPPELQAAIAEIRNHNARIAQAEQAERERLQTEVLQEIETFAADPKHAHYAEVKAHMAALLSQGAATTLQDAYDQACWASPTVRATLQAQERAAEEQKRKAEAKAKAEAAKRKSIGITGGPGNTAAATAPEGRSIRDELQAAMAAQSGAV